jgi:4-hydroxy-tetrahydrodipicolinate synthase
MQAGIEAHFHAIANATELPIILYDIPSRTNRELADATLVRLTQSGQFIGLRDGTGDVAPVPRLRALLPGGFRLMSGDDASALAFIASGGDGCISTVANVAPHSCRTIFACCRHDNWQSARALHNRLAPLAAA